MQGRPQHGRASVGDQVGLAHHPDIAHQAEHRLLGHEFHHLLSLRLRRTRLHVDEIVVPGMVERLQQAPELRDIALGRGDQVGEGDRVGGVGLLEVEGNGGPESGDGYGEFRGDAEEGEDDGGQHEAGDEQLDLHHMNFKNSAIAALDIQRIAALDTERERLRWLVSDLVRREREIR